jgi:glutaredoxin-related protein
MDEENLKREAEEFARSHKKQIAQELTDISLYAPDDIPISIFMAGSPGAGKTEYSTNLIKILERDKKRKVIRIDGDELRAYLPGYTGSNSYLFQGAISILVNKIHDTALEQKQTFLLDGTFANFAQASFNITRSLDKGRPVFIFYVYQEPTVAWRFTQAREIKEGRHIPKTAFIQQFLQARETVKNIRQAFDERVIIFLVKKNFETHRVEDVIQITPQNPSLDHHLPNSYTHSELENLL